MHTFNMFHSPKYAAIILLVVAALIGAAIAYQLHRPAGIATSQAQAVRSPMPPAPSQAGSSTVPTAALPAFKHIFLIVLENKEATDIVGSPAAPYLNHLATQGGRAANFYGIRHPSLPNYLALTGGDTFGITSNCTDCTVDQPNLVDQLEAAGKSWKAYMEAMPTPCFIGDAPPFYRQKHNPFIYYDTVRTNADRCNKIVPFDQLATDLGNNSVPDFVWITPNMCHDMHDCSIATGDTWLKQVVPTILASPAWHDHGVLFITFDEGTGNAGCCQYAAGGQIDTLVLSPLVQAGFVSPVAYDHYSVLRTIEAAWGLPFLGKAADPSSVPMTDFFQQP